MKQLYYQARTRTFEICDKAFQPQKNQFIKLISTFILALNRNSGQQFTTPTQFEIHDRGHFNSIRLYLPNVLQGLYLARRPPNACKSIYRIPCKYGTPSFWNPQTHKCPQATSLNFSILTTFSCKSYVNLTSFYNLRYFYVDQNE